VFAEFLPFVLVFPGMHTCVGLTVGCVWVSGCLCGGTWPSAWGSVSCRRQIRSDLHVCGERSGTPLITHFSRVFPRVNGRV